jgi:hypothetical protein
LVVHWRRLDCQTSRSRRETYLHNLYAPILKRNPRQLKTVKSSGPFFLYNDEYFNIGSGYDGSDHRFAAVG